MHTFARAPKEKSSEAAHVTPLSVLLLFFMEIITTLLLWRRIITTMTTQN
jgi:hypothetical protein